ncbi:hypothetical protein F4604DRAFT_1793662 [Suillus subluteus]|nr:hypothetical protein F4604DRAFT_1793662 [Suillus subluteus]
MVSRSLVSLSLTFTLLSASSPSHWTTLAISIFLRAIHISPPLFPDNIYIRNPDNKHNGKRCVFFIACLVKYLIAIHPGGLLVDLSNRKQVSSFEFSGDFICSHIFFPSWLES